MSPSALRVHTYSFINFPKGGLSGHQQPKLTKDGFVNLTIIDHFTVGKESVFRTGVGNLHEEVSSGD